MIAIGLMSGTSLDGIDAALVRILPQAASYRIDLLNFQTFPFEADVRDLLHHALPPHAGTIAQAATLHRVLGEAFGAAALEIRSDMPIDYVASHGQTVWHDGAASTTLQLGDAFAIRARIGATVCYDFRSADCSAGGHGAPLVPYADALLLASRDEDRLAANVGGIANVTILRRGAGAAEAVAFDTGPGNMLLDAFVRRRTNGQLAYDRDGALARGGRVDAGLVARMMADGYFAKPAPKTTGREYFGEQFAQQYARDFEALSLEDGAATLTAFTVETLADAIERHASAGARVLVSGGGAYNSHLMTMLRERLTGFRVERSDNAGLHAGAKEAIAFALLGYETLRGRHANIPAATGAREGVALGAIAPVNLPELLAKVEAECRAFS